MNVSIVMAAYNGEKYIEEQLDSILAQIGENDEIVISDDGSSDNTIDIVMSYTNSKNIKLLKGPGKGVSENFNNAILGASNDIIIICDQDDIWFENKIEYIKKIFLSKPLVNLVMHNANFCDFNGKCLELPQLFNLRRTGHGVWKNLLFSTYYGCCMAIRKEYLMKLMPLPSDVPYDQYIGLCAEYDRCSFFLDEILISHREHDNNVSTSKHNIVNMIKLRIGLIKKLNTYVKRKHS